MKKLIVVLIAAFSIITFCLIYIIKEGVSLRLGRVIEPTSMKLGGAEIAKALVSRLTPILQPSKYVIFGYDRSDLQAQVIMEQLQLEFTKNFKITPEVVEAESDFIGKCKTPCWVRSAPGDSNHLAPNDLANKLNQNQAKFFTLTILRFDRNIEVPAKCESEKRITIDCVTPLAVREAKRKFKEDSPYFFVRNYNEQDYFLFLENE